MKKYAFLPLILVVAFAFLGFRNSEPPAQPDFNAKTPVMQVLGLLGKEMPAHYMPALDPLQVKRGENIVKKGRTTSPEGKRTKIQSKYYKCTACHNSVREDPDITNLDPNARLQYAEENNIPFLQGTTFWGIVNRETWYNDDYVKKYGSAVEKARDNIRESIQLCSVGCSQGRSLEEWEIDAVVAYFWSLELKLGDLDISEEEISNLENAVADPNSHDAARTWVESKFARRSPAHFGDVPADKQAGYGHEGDATRGEMLYERSCLTCHGPNSDSRYLTLDKSNYSKSFFRRKFTNHNRYSLYEIIRHGTHSVEGHKAYMPYYTLERMSDQQVEDLRAYFEN